MDEKQVGVVDQGNEEYKVDNKEEESNEVKTTEAINENDDKPKEGEKNEDLEVDAVNEESGEEVNSNTEENADIQTPMENSHPTQEPSTTDDNETNGKPETTVEEEKVEDVDIVRDRALYDADSFFNAFFHEFGDYDSIIKTNLCRNYTVQYLKGVKLFLLEIINFRRENQKNASYEMGNVVTYLLDILQACIEDNNDLRDIKRKLQDLSATGVQHRFDDCEDLIPGYAREIYKPLINYEPSEAGKAFAIFLRKIYYPTVRSST